MTNRTRITTGSIGQSNACGKAMTVQRSRRRSTTRTDAPLRSGGSAGGRASRGTTRSGISGQAQARARWQALRQPACLVRRKRFLYDWRFGVAAAALAAIVLIAVIYGTGTLEGNSPEPPARETVVSALSVSGKETAQPGATESPEVVSDTQVFPPIDATHVVVVPLGFGASSTMVGSPVAHPTPGIALSTTLPTLPQTAPTWLLTAPDSTRRISLHAEGSHRHLGRDSVRSKRRSGRVRRER